MRVWACIAVVSLLPRVSTAGSKLTMDDRVELMRGLMAEYATVKELLPRSKKPLSFESSGVYDKKAWAEVAKQSGPAARTGDLVQITKVDIEDDKIVLQINGGVKGGRHWYDGVQVGMGGATNPVSNSDANAPAGTTIAILFHQPLEPMKAEAVKKMLSPILDFDRHSATGLYVEEIPPEVKKAIQEKRVTEGMDREQVVLALGRPDHKSRELKDGVETEDWVFGHPPGKIVFVTFNGEHVVKVKEAYAGLGSEVADQPSPR
jgi:hypothetical protein